MQALERLLEALLPAKELDSRTVDELCQLEAPLRYRPSTRDRAGFQSKEHLNSRKGTGDI